MTGVGRFICDNDGDAVVEATILFPVMTMIFAALVLIAIYMPSQALLQRATQYAATALATEMSDTWLSFNEGSMAYYWETDKSRLSNVYAKLFNGFENSSTVTGEKIAEHIESSSISSKSGELTVVCFVDNKIIYKEIIVEASREYPMPVNLTAVGFPKTITVEASSTAVVLNGDEFIRNMNLATDFASYIIDKFELGDIGSSISSFGTQVKGILGW